MRLELAVVSGAREGEHLVLRAILFNDSYLPVQVFRNAFVGPTVRGTTANGMPLPESVEPSFGQPEEALTLQPFTFYGRERTFEGLAVGEHQVGAEYQLPEGPLRASIAARVLPRAVEPS